MAPVGRRFRHSWSEQFRDLEHELTRDLLVHTNGRSRSHAVIRRVCAETRLQRTMRFEEE